MLSSTDTTGALREKQLDLVFRALGDQTRRKLLSQLARGPAMVTELARPFDMSLPAVGKHIRVLESAGLVEREIEGRVHLCSLNAYQLKSAGRWLSHYQKFWGETLDALGDYIENDDGRTQIS